MAEHAAQAMRFGNDLEACLKAIQIGFELSPRPSDSIYQGAVKTLEMVQAPSLPFIRSMQSLVYPVCAGQSMQTCLALQEEVQC